MENKEDNTTLMIRNMMENYLIHHLDSIEDDRNEHIFKRLLSQLDIIRYKDEFDLFKEEVYLSNNDNLEKIKMKLKEKINNYQPKID